MVAMLLLVAVFYFTHYLFASITAHVTAMLPVRPAVGMGGRAWTCPCSRCCW
jgi:L-tartrate/succinate antiporter